MKIIRCGETLRWIGGAVLLANIAFGAAPAPLNDVVEGQKLAHELQAMTPAGNTAVAGVLRISLPGAEPREVPVQSAVAVTPTNWTATYIASPTNGPPPASNVPSSRTGIGIGSPNF